jgi:hypothetical protein
MGKFCYSCDIGCEPPENGRKLCHKRMSQKVTFRDILLRILINILSFSELSWISLKFLFQAVRNEAVRVDFFVFKGVGYNFLVVSFVLHIFVYTKNQNRIKWQKDNC